MEAHRPPGEDRVEVIESPGGPVLVVADGAGGMSGGERAAEAVVWLAREAVQAGLEMTDRGWWAELILRMDREVLADSHAGETTAVVMGVAAGMVTGASVGDSGAWLVTEKNIDVLTRRQVRRPFLGSGAATAVPFQAPMGNATLMAASDGIIKYAKRDKIWKAALSEDLESAAREIIDLARLPTGEIQDDAAVILCRRLTR